MSPFAVTVIFILTVLFALLSLAPVLFGSTDMDSSRSLGEIKNQARPLKTHIKKRPNWAAFFA